MARDARPVLLLACTVCNRQNYATERNVKRAGAKKLELRKFCKWCRTHTLHKEQRIPSPKR